jgi:hypothetical protein
MKFKNTITQTFKIASIAIVLFFQTNIVSAQQEFEWDYYDLKMTLPSDFKVSKNTDHEFNAAGVGMEMAMYIFDNHHVTAKDMRKATEEVANELNIKFVDEWITIKERDFEGLYVEGADHDGNKVMLCGLINNKNATNFWVLIEFNDGDHNAKEDGLDILNSIR